MANSVIMKPRELLEAIRANRIQLGPLKAALYGTTLVSWKIDGRNILVQGCPVNGPYIRTSKGIMSSIGEDEDGARRSINLRAPDSGDLRECLEELQLFGERTIKENYPVWKAPEVPRTANIVKLMLSAGQDPNQISDEEIAAANTPRDNGFANPVMRKNVPIPGKVNEFYPPTFKCKINVKPYNNMPAASIQQMWDDETGKKCIEDIDYHALENVAFNNLPVFQVVGHQFKNDQWRILLSINRLIKVNTVAQSNAGELLLEEGEVAPVLVKGHNSGASSTDHPHPAAEATEEPAAAGGVKRPRSEEEPSVAHSEAKKPKASAQEDSVEDPNAFFS